MEYICNEIYKDASSEKNSADLATPWFELQVLLEEMDEDKILYSFSDEVGSSETLKKEIMKSLDYRFGKEDPDSQ